MKEIQLVYPIYREGTANMMRQQIQDITGYNLENRWIIESTNYVGETQQIISTSLPAFKKVVQLMDLSLDQVPAVIWQAKMLNSSDTTKLIVNYKNNDQRYLSIISIGYPSVQIQFFHNQSGFTDKFSKKGIEKQENGEIRNQMSQMSYHATMHILNNCHISQEIQLSSFYRNMAHSPLRISCSTQNKEIETPIKMEHQQGLVIVEIQPGKYGQVKLTDFEDESVQVQTLTVKRWGDQYFFILRLRYQSRYFNEVYEVEQMFIVPVSQSKVQFMIDTQEPLVSDETEVYLIPDIDIQYNDEEYFYMKTCSFKRLREKFIGEEYTKENESGYKYKQVVVASLEDSRYQSSFFPFILRQITDTIYKNPREQSAICFIDLSSTRYITYFQQIESRKDLSKLIKEKEGDKRRRFSFANNYGLSIGRSSDPVKIMGGDTHTKFQIVVLQGEGELKIYDFTTVEKNRLQQNIRLSIKLNGIRQLTLAYGLRNKLKRNNNPKLTIVPYFRPNDETIDGTFLVLKDMRAMLQGFSESFEDDDYPFLIVKLHNYNNPEGRSLLSYQNPIACFGSIVVRDNFDTAKQSLMKVVQLKQKVTDSANFNPMDCKTLTDRLNCQLENTVPFVIQEFVRQKDFGDKKTQSFFDPQEIFYGRTLADLYMRNSRMIEDILKKNCKRLLGDFDMASHLLRCYQFNQNETAEVYMQYLLTNNPQNNFSIIMANLSKILSQPKFGNTFITGFLNKDDETVKMNLEKYLDSVLLDRLSSNHNTIAIKFMSEKSSIYQKLIVKVFLKAIQKTQIQHPIQVDQPRPSVIDIDDNFHRFVQDRGESDTVSVRESLNPVVVQEVKSSKQQKKKIFVEHTYINFRQLSLQKKVEALIEGREYKLDDYTLAQFVLEPTNKEFYDQQTVRLLIEIQFKGTKEQYQKLFIFYILFFICPFSLICSIQNDQFTNNQGKITYFQPDLVVMTSYYIAFLPQILLIIIEVIHFNYLGFNYIKNNILNLANFLQFIIFVALFSLELVGVSTQEGSQLLTATLLKISLSVLAFIKVLFFLRIYDQFGFIVRMVTVTMRKTIPFTIFLFVCVFFYAINQLIINEKADQDPELSKPANYIMGQYRKAIGDLNPPSYGDWMNYPDGQSNIHIVAIVMWLIWFSQTILNQIILLNLLVAVIFQVYEHVVAEYQTFNFINKAQLNIEYYQTLDLLGRNKEFNVIVIQKPQDQYNLQQGLSDMQGMTLNIKDFIDEASDTLRIQIDDSLKDQRDNQRELQKQLGEIKKEMQEKIESVKEDFNSKISNLNEKLASQGELQLKIVQDLKKLLIRLPRNSSNSQRNNQVNTPAQRGGKKVAQKPFVMRSAAPLRSKTQLEQIEDSFEEDQDDKVNQMDI